ncbi:MAG: phosphatase PAP2 family protein [Candidatus Saccharimonadales bacterium]
MEHLVKFAADGLLIVILAITACVGLYHVVKARKIRRLAPVAIMAAITALYVAKLLSIVYQPSEMRPYIQRGLEAGASYINNPGFPSDHALLATVAVIMLAAVTPYKKLAVGLFILVIIMSAARVVALVHTPMDVIGGIFTAGIGALWYLKVKN